METVKENKPKRTSKKTAKLLKVPYTAENKKFVPTYKSKSAAGFDVYANESFWLMPGRWRPVKTGWRFALPEGYAFLSCSRSGNAVKRGLISHIAPGILDADYRGGEKAGEGEQGDGALVSRLSWGMFCLFT